MWHEGVCPGRCSQWQCWPPRPCQTIRGLQAKTIISKYARKRVKLWTFSRSDTSHKGSSSTPPTNSCNPHLPFPPHSHPASEKPGQRPPCMGSKGQEGAASAPWLIPVSLTLTLVPLQTWRITVRLRGIHSSLDPGPLALAPFIPATPQPPEQVINTLPKWRRHSEVAQ